MSTSRRQFALSVAALLTPCLSRAALPPTAQIIASFPPGGTVDFIARQLAEHLRGHLASTVVVDNKAGAGGRLAVAAIKQLPADGLNLMVNASGIVSLLPHTYKKLTYSPFEDIVPVSLTNRFEFGFAVGPAVPATVKTMVDYFAWVKANPGMDSFASPAAGSGPHFVGQLAGRAGGVELRAIQYRGTQPGLLDVLGGQIPAISTTLPDVVPTARTGKIRVLGTTGSARSRFLPEAPTFQEQGLKDLVYDAWYAVFVHGKTPVDVQQHISGLVRTALAAPALVRAFEAVALIPGGSTPAEVQRLARVDNERWGAVVKKLNFNPEE